MATKPNEKRDQNMIRLSDHSSSLRTILSTSLASVAACVLTVPAERYQQMWRDRIMSAWSARNETVVIETSSLSVHARRLVSPLFRLFLYEVTSSQLTKAAEAHYLGKMGDKYIAHHGDDATNRVWRYIPEEVLTGALAGICQAIMLCPLEAKWAQERNVRDMANQNSWYAYLRDQIFEGGSMVPKDRLQRAYHGVGLLAVREMLLNVTFFPLFGYLQRRQQQLFHHDRKKDLFELIPGGMVAGSVCALVVFPIDMARMYLRYSGQKFSFWTGLQTVAPPWSLLVRTWSIQALVMGPAFGLVAAIYEFA